MWNKQDYNLFFKADEMDRINIIYDYMFEPRPQSNKQGLALFSDKVYKKTDSLILFIDYETILVFGKKRMNPLKIKMYKKYLSNFIMNGFIIQSKKLNENDQKYFNSLKDKQLKKQFNLIKKYKVIYGNSLNLISLN
jgi:hypothetical protein